MKIRTSRYVRVGQVLIVTDYEHPEVEMINFSWGPNGLESEPAEIPDGRIVYCNPVDEKRVRDLLALAQERMP